MENQEKTTITISAVSQFREDFVKQKLKDVQCYKSGIETIDRALQGGFYEGNLNMLTAESSYGKTTLAIQIAENIAREYDADIFIFSMETPKNFIFAKSINRLTYFNGDNSMTPSINSMTTINKALYEALDAENRERVDYCTNEFFDTYGKNMYIVDVVGADFSARNIYDVLKTYRELKPDRKLFVVVDYLQILSSINKNTTDTERIKENVLELKKTCNDCKCTMLLISSKARASYAKDASMTNFYGSSSIEYSADVALDLIVNTDGVEDKEAEIKAQLQSNKRNMKLVLLKQRYGKRMQDIYLEYRSDKDVFFDVSSDYEEYLDCFEEE